VIRLLVVLIVTTGCGRDIRKLRQWLADWETTRACLLTDSEYGPDSRTAFTVSSLFRDTRCFERRLALRYPTDEIRDAIPDFDALEADLRTLGDYVQDGSAIDRVDAHVARLRRIARLPPIVRPHRKLLEVLPVGGSIQVDGESLRSMSFDLRGRILARFSRGDQTLLAEVTAPDDVRTVQIPFRSTLAYPSRSWTAAVVRDELVVREVGSDDPVTIAIPGAIEATDAMDAGQARVVIVQTQGGPGGFAAAVSHDGLHWHVEWSPDHFSLQKTSQDPVTGSIDVFTHSMETAFLHHFAPSTPWRFPAGTEVPRFEHHVGCRDGDVMWAMDARLTDTLFRISPDAATTFRPGDVYPEGIADCSTKAAVAIRRGNPVRCRDAACERLPVPSHHEDRDVALLDDGRWIYGAVLRDVAVIWVEGRQPAVYRLAEAGKLEKIVVLKGVTYLIMEVAGTFKFVPLPRV
jgi:hypothetical protein